METINDIAPFLPSQLQQGDYVAFSFFVATVAMIAATVFFFFQFALVPRKYKNSVLLLGLITMIAAINYFYMRDYWVENRTSPTEFRYFDWILTVPLMCLEFYLLLKPLGAKIGMPIRLITASIWMLVWGYVGEAIDREHSFTYGSIATLGMIALMTEIFLGIPRYINKSKDLNLRRGYWALCIYILVGWTIYPIGFMAIPGNVLSNFLDRTSLDVIYNIADVVNKVGFGLIMFAVITQSWEYRQMSKKLNEMLLDNPEKPKQVPADFNGLGIPFNSETEKQDVV